MTPEHSKGIDQRLMSSPTNPEADDPAMGLGSALLSQLVAHAGIFFTPVDAQVRSTDEEQTRRH